MPVSLDNVYCVILAAGNSSRMVEPKQLLIWQDVTLLEHAIYSVEPILKSRVIVVLGANSEVIHSAVEFKQVTVVNNTDWQTGIASSICSGLGALPPNASAVLILLCDQPLISAIQINRLLKEWQKQPQCIVVSTYYDTVGVPAVFPSAFLDELKTLKGDVGAKNLFSKYPNKLVTVPLAEAMLDIDTMADYNQLTNQFISRINDGYFVD